MGLDMNLFKRNKKESDGYEKVGYWRKANQIHNWFVQNCQNGIDECQGTEVTKEKLEDLLITCIQVLNKSTAAEELLPVTKGCFFGGYDYDQWYFQNIEETVEILKRVIKETDFEKEKIFYKSSW